jgi:hypothetical protein
MVDRTSAGSSLTGGGGGQVASGRWARISVNTGAFGAAFARGIGLWRDVNPGQALPLDQAVVCAPDPLVK